MTRPRETADEALLSAAYAAMLQEGPEGFTLAAIGARAGVSSATLIKRFGSKDSLLERMSEQWASSVRPGMASVVEQIAEPVERIVVATTWLVADLDDRDNVANQLAALANDLQHVRLRRILQEGWFAAIDQLHVLVDEAVVQGRLAPTVDQRRVAPILVALAQGTALLWSLEPTGSLVDMVRHDVEGILANWENGAERGIND